MPMRILMVGEREWTVWDVFPTFDARMRMTGESADQLVQGWLVFECDLEKRRLGPVPEGWDELSDEELATLLESAVSVQRRTGEAGGSLTEALG
ncbi:MAG TPA: hypothetical protein VF613_09715 [Longimicrobium sp.]|jgi:hypothetical protein